MKKTEMDEATIRAYRDQIDGLDQMEMARLWRFAPSGHPFFDSTLPLFEYFQERFKKLGGFTPAISKALG